MEVSNEAPRAQIAWACPACGARLDFAARRGRCARHGEVATVSADGVLEFDSSDAYWGEVSREQMRDVNRAARRAGWRAALDHELRAIRPDLVDYVHHPARADWQVLLPLDRERTAVLDVGAGWGANSFGVAPNAALVVAVEKIAERIEWIAIRRAQDGIQNLIPVRAELHRLPFAPESFDVIVVNGVLEWAGLVDPDAAGRRAASPRTLQERFLRRLGELLRPGGSIYIGIENRFGMMFLRGAPDHQGLRYTSLMPKPAARAYTALRAAVSPRTHHVERDYRTWIYSFAGYRELLARCGFIRIERYASIPGYNVPTSLVPLESKGPMRWMTDRVRARSDPRAALRRAAARFLATTGAQAWVTSCYALVAQRPERRP